MPSPRDFVYTQIYKGALQQGANERQAKDNAVMGLEDYRRGKYDKVKNLIFERIKLARRMSK